MTGAWSSRLDHLDALTDHLGLFEHAKGTLPRPEHGYCVDDNARMLVLLSRERDDGQATRLSRTALVVCLTAIDPDGRSHNRLDRSGAWTDRAETTDSWGRNLWALGVASTNHDDRVVRAAALAGFNLASRQRSTHPRALAFAALGACEVYTADETNSAARSLLNAFMTCFVSFGTPEWAWPERRLTYANATLAEATIASGVALQRPDVLERGLSMLSWLLDRETTRGHLSVTGVGGCGPSDLGPQFDQQPIEVAAMAGACWRARSISDDRRWAQGVELAGRWFDGDNDTGAVMFDDTTGGGYDGLQAVGVNTNQGAESTLALLATRQRVHELELATAGTATR